MRRLSTVPLWITLIGIGISIIAFTLPQATSLTAEAKRESSYVYALLQEIDHNKMQAESTVRQYTDHKKIVIAPTYTSTAYEAVTNAGLLSIFKDRTSADLISLYAHIAQGPMVYEAATKSRGDEASLAAISAFHAKITESYISDYNKHFSISDDTVSQASSYNSSARLGIGMALFATLGGLIDLLARRQKPISLPFSNFSLKWLGKRRKR